MSKSVWPCVESIRVCVLFGCHVRQLDSMTFELAWDTQSQLAKFRLRIEGFDTFSDFWKVGTYIPRVCQCFKLRLEVVLTKLYWASLFRMLRLEVVLTKLYWAFLFRTLAFSRYRFVCLDFRLQKIVQHAQLTRLQRLCVDLKQEAHMGRISGLVLSIGTS